MLPHDVCEDAFRWVMLGRPVTLAGLADAMPTLALMGMKPLRGDCIVLPDGAVIDVIAAPEYNPPVSIATA